MSSGRRLNRLSEGMMHLGRELCRPDCEKPKGELVRLKLTTSRSAEAHGEPFG
jgi:hypothetical protein